MGERALSSTAGDELVAIGLGSCIGLTLIDEDAGVVGLSHVVLPESLGKDGPKPKFADLAVPDLIEAVIELGAAKRRLKAILIGGAKMFASTSTNNLDIGSRNAQAVREALGAQRIAIVAEDVGGTRGRTASIILGGEISSRAAGGDTMVLWSLNGRKAAVGGTGVL